ncbi:MAG TPA: polyprenyl synthetase family protein [bacterium]|nr:polyprenyl synthetase family protein [bacterium]
MDKGLADTLTLISGGLEEFEKRFAEELGGHAGLIGAMAAHVLASPGKRIRPAMYLLSSYVHTPDRQVTIEGAVAIELIHTATLLHDDVNDNADQRRGRPSANRIWGNLAAVLMGDHLFAKAFRVMVDTGNPRILRTISLATERVAVGELLQLQETGNIAATEAIYLRIIGDKTASLFSAACEAGALTHGNEQWGERFRSFGEYVGLGFQIADDLLDYWGDTARTGKPTGNDLKAGKVTLPLIYALRDAQDSERRDIARVLTGGSDNGIGEVVDFVRARGGFAYAQAKAENFRNLALEQIADLADSAYKRALIEVVNHSVSRQS